MDMSALAGGGAAVALAAFVVLRWIDRRVTARVSRHVDRALEPDEFVPDNDFDEHVAQAMRVARGRVPRPRRPVDDREFER